MGLMSCGGCFAMIMIIWVSFVVLVVLLLALDLGVFHRSNRVIRAREALLWTLFWVVLSLLFNGVIYFMYEHHWLGIGAEIGHKLTGSQAALQYFTGYVLEKSLSLDNIFVIAMIFSYFNVPLALQHRVLFWGIVGALIMRGLMILGGAALISRFHWMTYIFGAALILTAIKMLITRHDSIEPEKNLFVRLARRLFVVTDSYHDRHFMVSIRGRRALTPLFIALVVIESTDVMFALDSIPAIFAVTRDPFIVFTSNIFAILGLRSLYFALAAIMHRFRYIKMSLVFVLAYVGVKMLLANHHPIPTGVSLAIIGGIIFVGAAASIYAGKRDTAPLTSPLKDDELS
jgi:tellurite resistance protein TerC